MKILNRYIGLNLLFTALSAMAILTFVMVSANLIRAFQLLAKGADLLIFFKFILYLFPDMLTFTIPLACLVSSVLVFSRFSAEQEITAMRASGVSIWQIITFGLLLGVCASLLCVWLHISIAPVCRYKAYQLRKTAGMQNPMLGIEAGRYIELPGYLICIEERDKNNLKNIQIFTVNKDENVDSTLTAKSGKLIVDKKHQSIILALNDVIYSEIDLKNPQNTTNTHISSKTLNFPFNYGDKLNNRRLSRKIKHMDFSMLAGNIARCRKYNLPTSRLYMEIHSRLSLAMSPLAFFLLGIPFGIKTQRSERSVGLLLCIGLAMGFYVFLVLAGCLKNQPQLHPEILVWLPNIIYQAGGLFALSRIAKR